MTNDDIIKLALKAGFGVVISDLCAPTIERFANLVAAAEREECAKVCEGEYEAADCAAAIRARGEA